MIGADISNHQRGLTMDELKAQGVEFVIIKATQGTHFVDPCGAAFYAAACKAGLPPGVYCYSEATTPVAAEAEARYLLEHLRGFPMPCGVYLDVERPEQLRMPDEELTKTVQAFCRVIRNAGYKPGVYSSEYSAWSKLDRAALGDDVIVWVAHYGKTPAMPCDLWQGTESHQMPGHEFKLDIDLARSERFKRLVEEGRALLEKQAQVESDAPPEPASQEITGALAMLAAYLQTEEFAQNFKTYIERSVSK